MSKRCWKREAGAQASCNTRTTDAACWKAQDLSLPHVMHDLSADGIPRTRHLQNAAEGFLATDEVGIDPSNDSGIDLGGRDVGWQQGTSTWQRAR